MPLEPRPASAPVCTSRRSPRGRNTAHSGLAGEQAKSWCHGAIGVSVAVAVTIIIAVSSAGANDALVRSVEKAPVSPDGDVAGARTELTINLAVDLDPTVPGLALKKGERIVVRLPGSFVFAEPEAYPITDFLASDDCAAGRLACSTVILLQGWPQHPILPSFPPGEEAQYTLKYDSYTNALTLVIEKSLKDAPLPGPGIKQIHLGLLGFRNPAEAGEHPIDVAVLDPAGKTRASGRAFAKIRPQNAPSLNVTSIFDENGAAPPNPNTLFQRTKVGEPTPLPFDFLVWDASGDAFDGLQVAEDPEGNASLMYHGERVGTVTIEAPEGAVGHTLSSDPATLLLQEPVFGAPIETGRLTANFVAGSKPGRYRITLALDGGNSVTHVVDVVRR